MVRAETAAAASIVPFRGGLSFPRIIPFASARDARGVEVSMDRPLEARPPIDDYWWHDWTGYGSGGYVVCARISAKASQDTLPRACAWHCPRPRG